MIVFTAGRIKHSLKNGAAHWWWDFCSRGQYNQHHIDDNNTTNMKQNKLKIWSLTCEERWRRLSLRLFVRAFALQTFFWRQAVLELETFKMPFHSSLLCIWLNVNGCPRFMKLEKMQWQEVYIDSAEHVYMLMLGLWLFSILPDLVWKIIFSGCFSFSNF